MKTYLLAGAALATLAAAPAAARDNSGYFGIEAGAMWLNDFDIAVDGDELFTLEHKMGVDGDLIAGYDFGVVRAELELGYKWAEWNEIAVIDGDELLEGDADGHSRSYSMMGNVMADLGNDSTVNFYIGAGAGFAQLRTKTEPEDPTDFELKNTNFAWQIIAGVRGPVFRYFDVGVKYRYFNGGRIEDNLDGFDVRTDRWRSHSILASLIYNFNAPAAPPPPPMVAPPPPPPPPPPPATQTCPDGTVILATEVCPAPPPPPPPPPPAPERG